MRAARAFAATSTLLLLAACTAAQAGSAKPAGTPSTGRATTPGSTSSAGPSAGMISFTTDHRGQVMLVRPDGSDKRELVAENGAPAALSPDGRQIMYAVVTPAGTDTIAFVAADGADRRPLKAPRGWNLIPGVWSPDAQRVSVAREGDEDAHGGVYTVGPDGSGFQRLSDPGGAGYDFPLGWSGDGRWIAFMRVPSQEDGAFTGQLYVVAADGRSRPWHVNPPGTRVRHFYVPPASFFPDSGRIAFVATRPVNESSSTTVGRVMIADLSTHQVSKVTDWSPWTLTTDVSPDEQWLVFDKPAGIGDPDHRLFVVHPDGSDLRPVTASTPGSTSAVWSPDGTALLAAIGATDTANNIGVIPVDGPDSSDVVQLTRTGGDTYVFYDWVQQG